MKMIVTAEGAEKVIDVVAGVAERALDMSEAMKDIQTVMLRSAHETFLAGGRPSAWVPLSEATIKRRRNKDKGSIAILRDTGYLWQSLSPDNGNEFSVRLITPDSASIGTNRPGAMAHQKGNARLPQRRFLVHQDQDIEDYRQIILDHLTGLEG